jgi:YHS domain-containing protein
MMVDEKKTQLRSEYDGRSFFFCSAYCKRAFDQSPGKYGLTA